MRRCIAWTITLLAGAWLPLTSSAQTAAPAPAGRPAAGQQRPAAPAPATRGTAATGKTTTPPLDPATQKAKAAAEARAKNDMDLLLNEWEKQSAKVKSLQVVFERIDKSVAWGDKVSQGMAMLKSPDLACLEFKRAIPDANGKPRFILNASGQKELNVEKEPYQRIVCTGKDVLQYEWDEKVLFVYPLNKEARQKALQQGPLPFLFNMKAAEARQRYEMNLMPGNEDPKHYYIRVVPKEEIDKKDFKAAHVWLNKETFLPSKLILLPVGDKDLQEFHFSVINPNQPIDDKFFAMVVPDKWKVERNADPNHPNAQAVAPPAAQGAPKRVAVQPAPKSARQP